MPCMQSIVKILWISNVALGAMVAEADRKFPLETGGILVGYFAENGDPVVCAAIGPGPHAIHWRKRFTPDHAWQCTQLDEIYEQSSGSNTYLGDWHTHPNGVPQMSWLDRRTLNSIAKHPQTGITNPVMLIGGGMPKQWQWVGHQHQGKALFGLLSRCDKQPPQLFHPT